jgi:cell division protein FtsI/penicillin-binding protein 2
MKKWERITVIGIVLSIFLGLIFLRMVYLQYSPSGQYLKKLSDDNYMHNMKVIEPEIGNIYDRFGNLLAGNKMVYEIGVDLTDINRNPYTIAKYLSGFLGKSFNELYDLASAADKADGNHYNILDDFVDGSVIDKISATQESLDKSPERALEGSNKLGTLRGVAWKPHMVREYPENALASNIIGFYQYLDRQSGGPQYGVEEEFRGMLAGVPQTVDVSTQPRTVSDIPVVPPGDSLVLTINRSIQQEVEKILDKAVEKNKAVSGTIVVYDPKTGEILAMATNPRINPNKYWEFQDLGTQSYNRAIDITYEPGSVFKVLTMLAALDSGAVTPDTIFVDHGSIEMGGYTIYDWDRNAWGAQTMTGCMQHSLNVCLTWVAQQLGPTRFYSYMKAFGIGQYTNVDLAGEKITPLAIPGDNNWYEINLGTNSFGQGLAVTPVQMVQAVGAAANNGKMMYPHILKAIIKNGEKTEFAPRQIGQPVSAKAAHTLTNMLAISLEEEASNALVEGYRVAGKTGTAEIPTTEGYISNVTNASFVGWGPVDDPQFVVYVWLEKPKSSIWGSIVAAPIFASVVEKLVVLMDIPTDEQRRLILSKN